MNHSKLKRKKYFSSNLMAKKKRDLFVKPGIKGYLCTCNNSNERQCVRESYNILNEYADKLYGEEKLDGIPEPDDNENASAENDVLDEFQKEVDSMKTQSAEKTRRFQALDTGIVNCVFIETKLKDPVNLLYNIMADLFKTKQKKVRFLIRMVPVETTCRAFMEDVEKAARLIFEDYFKAEPTTYAVVFNKRNNSSLDRDAVIEKLASLVQEKNVNHKVNLTSPDLTIIVEVMKNICCLAVVRDYFKFSKFNLHGICGGEKPGAEGDALVENAEIVPNDSVSPAAED